MLLSVRLLPASTCVTAESPWNADSRFFPKGEDFSLKTAVPEVLHSLNNYDL